MKKKFRKDFHREFPWYDHTFLLEAMILWLNNASKRHSKDGHLLRSNRTAKQLRIVSGVLKRIIDDNYDAPNKVFISRNRKSSCASIFKDDWEWMEDFEYLDFKWQVWTRIPDKYHDPETDGEIAPLVYGNMKEGIFYQSKKEVWNNKIEPYGTKDPQKGNYLRVITLSPKIVVSGDSLLDGVIPPFQEGWGCCNWSSGRLHCPTCTTEIGIMHLDCYEDYSVRFDVNKVERSYTK